MNGIQWNIKEINIDNIFTYIITLYVINKNENINQSLLKI